MIADKIRILASYSPETLRKDNQTGSGLGLVNMTEACLAA